MEDIGRICVDNEFCTNCPARTKCGMRELFYDNDAYEAVRAEVFVRASMVAALLGTPTLLIPLEVGANIQAMDKRRRKELELHPKYSPI